MSLVDSNIRTSTCDTCGITATFEVTSAGVAKEVVDANPWLTTQRLVNTPFGKTFFYCSDKCELAGIGEAKHNPPVPSALVQGAPSQAAIQAALASAKAAKEANEAIKAGKPANIVVTQ